jgi:hypothetical protein
MGVPMNPMTRHPKFADDIMPNAYPKYSHHPDAAAHVKQFWSIWAVNHGTQGLTPMEREQSMIVEFQLSLEGQTARWYAQQDTSTFTTFQELMDKFKELFQVQIDPTEVLKEYYSLQQQAGESVAEFSLRFHAMQAMLDTPPSKDIQKRQFLKALKEPLRSSFALLDSSTVPLTEIVNRALNLDHQQLGLGLSQFRVLAPSPRQRKGPSSRRYSARCVYNSNIPMWSACSGALCAKHGRTQ